MLFELVNTAQPYLSGITSVAKNSTRNKKKYTFGFISVLRPFNTIYVILGAAS